jgi:hypothetical protein
VLLGENRKLERPSGLAATVAAATPQKRRRLKLGALVITTSSATDDLHPTGLPCEFLWTSEPSNDLSLLENENTHD